MVRRWRGTPGAPPAEVEVLRRYPAFRRLWVARVLSLMGDGIALTALLLFVSGSERRGVAVGGLLVAQGLPRLLSPLAGALADRLDQRSLMVACDLGQAVLFGLIALLLPAYPLLVAMVGPTGWG